MKVVSMKTRTQTRSISALFVAFFASLALVGCAPAATEAETQTPIAPIASDVWVKAVPELMEGMAMTGVFMTLENPTDEDIYLEAAINDTPGLTDMPLEVHEVVMNDAGEMIMQEVAGKGILIPAGGSVVLKPGGYHVMYMGLLETIPVGSTIALTLEFSNGSTLTVEAVAREIANANETYDPSMDMESEEGHSHDESDEGHSH
jgi:copper(I)-binding protein